MTWIQRIAVGIVIVSLFLGVILPSAPVSAEAKTFGLETIATFPLGESLSMTQMAIDSSGHAHLAYANVITGGMAIFYATNRGGTWAKVQVDGPYDSYSVSSFKPSAWIAIDSVGTVSIMYEGGHTPSGQNTVFEVKLATKLIGSSDFSISTVLPGQQSSIRSMCSGPDGSLSALIIGNQSGLVYAKKSIGQSWVMTSLQNLNAMNYGGSGSIAIGTDGEPQLALVNSSSIYNASSSQWEDFRLLEYVHRVSGNWVKEVVDSAIGRDYFTQIGLNTTNSPRIMYGRDDGASPAGFQEVRYVERSAAGWGSAKVMQSYPFEFWIPGSMSMDGDIAHMVYEAPMAASGTSYSNVMNYSYGKGGDFSTQMVSSSIGGSSPCLRVDANGNLHLAFTYVNNGLTMVNLTYATTMVPTGRSEPLDLLTDESNSTIELRWTQPTSSVGITGYVVQVSNSSSFSTILSTLSVSSSVKNVTMHGLTNGADYYLRVKAVYGDTDGPFSLTVHAIPNSASPTGGGIDSTLLLGIGLVIIMVAVAGLVIFIRKKK